MKRSKRILNLTFALLIVLIGIPCLMTYREAARLERNRALLHAIRQKDVVGVQLLLHQGADPNSRELPEPPSGSFWQRLKALFDLLRHGPPRAASDAPSALMLAVDVDNAPIVTALLNAGAKDVNARIKKKVNDMESEAPLIVSAAAAGNVESVQALLAYGAEIEARNSEGRTALIAGASTNALRDEHYQEYPETVRKALEQKQTAVVRLLLERGARIQAADNVGCTALTGVAYQDNKAMAQLLLDKGADPNVQCNDYYKETPLGIAAENDNIALVKALLRKGAKVEMPGSQSPLLNTSNPDMLALLLDHGADIHARRLRGKHEGETVLIHVSYGWDKGTLKSIRLLLAHGADINENSDPESQQGATPLMRAAQYAGTDVVRYLLDHGAKVNIRGWPGSVLMCAIEDGNFDTACLLLQRGANVNIAEGEGLTPLMRTADWGDEDFARELLRRGAKVNARDSNGSTALHYAVEDNNAEMVELLLEWGANVNARSKDGHTPLADACNPQSVELEEGDTMDEVIALLRAAGGKK